MQFVNEVFLIRGRRLYSIARLSIYESNRKMWAPWVVITVFLLVLAFTHWFLQPPRAAEMGRLYVGTLSLLVLDTPDRHGHDHDAALACRRTSSSRRFTQSSRSRCGDSS